MGALVLLGAALLVAAAASPAPGDSSDAVRSISSALRTKNYQQALDLARTALHEWPQEVRIHVLEGMALSGMGSDAEALASFSAALKIAPDYVPALEAAAQIEYKSGSPNATGYLERLLSLRPNEETAHAMMAVLADKRGDCETAVRHFTLSKHQIAAQPEALFEFGGCLLKLRRPDEALPVFKQLVSSHPEDRYARYAMAVSLLDAKRPREALGPLAPLLDSKNPDPTTLELASAAHEALGETPEAVALLRDAIVRDPRNVRLYLDFASLSFTHQSFQVGIDMINAGLNQMPDSASLYLARGVMAVQLAKFEDADRDFDRAERLDPKQVLGGVVRGLSQIQQNNLDQALNSIHTQLKDRPKDEFLYYVLAELLSRQGAQPGNPEFDEALQAAREAVRLKPDFALARDVLSRLYLQNGEKDQAIEQCRLALRDDPSDEVALYRLIRTLQSSGRKDAAEEVPALLERFTALRQEARKREAQESRYRLVSAPGISSSGPVQK